MPHEMINLEEEAKQKERVIIAALDRGSASYTSDILDEMERLVETAGGEVVGRVVQRRKYPHPAYYFGKGKLREIKRYAEALSAETLIVDGELTASQKRNIEDITGLKVVDRTQLILDIFAQHATTEEGKLQVELAQLEYNLPRLVGMGKEMSRLGGGIGTRGPGEKKLEVDRRRIRRRISVIKRQLADLEKDRELRRKKRKRENKIVSLVGYTNAGKSTLLRRLSGDKDVFVADMLFATLAPTMRRVALPSGRTVIFADTVGFIRRLPHTLIEAFKATLEEIKESDLALIILDATDENYKDKLRVVKGVLKEIGAEKLPLMLVFNKIDLLDKEDLEDLKREYTDALFVSAKTGEGIDKLLEAVDEKLFGESISAEVFVPYDKTGVLWSFKDKLQIEKLESFEHGEKYKVAGPKEDIKMLIGKLGGE
ncbi:GTPase HflX [Zhurongbacter thermophilus]